MPSVSVLMKPASGQCNMHCDYCFYCDEMEMRAQASHGFMSEGTLRNIIRRTLLRAEGAASYAFQGGEPTLRGIPFFEKAVAWQKQYNKNGVRVQNALQTNGLLIDDKWCEFLKENHFLVGLSVDGTKTVHDRYRHLKGSDASAFERALRAADLLEKHGVDFNILTVVTADAAQSIKEIYAFYASKGWKWQQYIACLDPLKQSDPEEDDKKRSYSLSADVYGQFLIDLFELWYADFKKDRQPYIRQFENWIGILMGVPPEACDQRGCCGVQYVCEAGGEVYPCDFYMLDDYRLGNFNEDRLDALDAKRREIGFIERSFALDKECQKCEFYAICRGGCQRNRDLTAEGTYRNYFCEAYKQFFGAELPKMREIAEKIRRR